VRWCAVARKAGERVGEGTGAGGAAVAGVKRHPRVGSAGREEAVCGQKTRPRGVEVGGSARAACVDE